MERRSLLGFIVLNICVTFLVAFLVISLSGNLRPQVPATTRSGLLQVVITATPDPNLTPEVIYVVVTVTPIRPVTGVAILPTNSDGTPGADVPTLDPSLLPPSLSSTDVPTITPTDPSGCPTHTVKQGEFPGAIAQLYNVTLTDLMAANNLTERDATRLKIGQVLIVPIRGCGLKTAVPSITPSPTRSPTPTPPPTSTTAPTAVQSGAKIEVVQVVSPGDITGEGIEIRNISPGLIEIGGWKMSDKQGNTFTFPDYQMFEGRRVVIYTRTGSNTPFALFWGLARPVWGEPGQEITIRDTEGEVQLKYSMEGDSGSGDVVPTPTP